MKESRLMVNKINTDVLVIGGGAAGARAAFEANESGAKVTLAVKGELGVMGVRGAGATGSGTPRYLHLFTSAGSGTVEQTPTNISDIPHQREIQGYYNRAIIAGLGIADRKLVRILTEGAPAAKEFLDKNGLVLGPSNPNNPHGIESNINPMPGLGNLIRRYKDISLMQHTMVLDLIVEDNICKGALVVGELSGELTLLKAGAVVLATGGTAQLFELNYHPTCITGDGYAMAYRAGAEIMNMEFEQMFISTVFPTVTMVPYPVWRFKPRVLNVDGKEFIQNYLPPDVTLEECLHKKTQHGPFSTRDASKYFEIALVKESIRGGANEHNAFYLEVPSEMRKNPDLFFPEYEDWYTYRGIDFSKDFVEINTVHHCSNGGLVIDENAQTTISGLYAVGEVATGAYGADRLGGAMMTSCQVFGSRAGKNAAQTAMKRDKSIKDEQDWVQQAEQLIGIKNSKGTQKPADIIRSLKHNAWQKLLVVRSKASLTDFLGEIEHIRKDLLPAVQCEDSRDLVAALELRNLVQVGEIIARAALKRTESRGSHYREDYPQQDDEQWVKAITIKNTDGGMVLSTRVIDENWNADDTDLGWWG